MKAIGIVAEYNPFHNGHLYQIEMIKKKYPDYAIVVVMSGHFMQRGDVSIIDKWKRCEIALKNGVDLVVELPYPFATQSADIFAYGAITILEKLKCERVVFGSESNSIDDLELIARCQLENKDFDSLVHYYSKMGKNYPTALSCALEELTGKKIDTPNDLLGISYIKTILKHHYKIIPEAIERSNHYHSLDLEENISSASAIREAIKRGVSVKDQVPKDELSYFKYPRFFDDYYRLLQYRILSEDDLSIYHTVDEGIEYLLKSKINDADNLEDFISLIKSKRYTYNKITRMLVHILCNFTKEQAASFQDITYIRILGFKKKGKEYLNIIKKDLDVPLISKITREKDEMLEFEIYATGVYNLINNENLVKREFEKIVTIGEK